MIDPVSESRTTPPTVTTPVQWPADHATQPERESPLSISTITEFLTHLLPPSPSGIPSHLLAHILRTRHHFLSITPDDQTSYFFLNPDHPLQNTERVLTVFRELAGSNLEDVVGRVAYAADGEDVVAHVQIGNEVQILLQWEHSETTGDWKYLDAKPLPFPANVYQTLRGAQESRTTHNVSPIVEDPYWSRYDGVVPSVANGTANSKVNGINGLLGRDSPRGEEAYWERYGQEDSDDESQDAHHRVLSTSMIPPGGYNPASAWTASSVSFPVADDELAAALAMHLQPDLEPSSEVAQGLTVSLNTPPASEPSSNATPELESRPLSRQRDETITNNATLEEDVECTEGVSDALRGVYKLWKTLKKGRSASSSEDKERFLALVSESISDL